MSEVTNSFLWRLLDSSCQLRSHWYRYCASANLELVDKFCYLGGMLSVDGDTDAAAEARIWMDGINSGSGYHCNEDISLYSSCVRSSMLRGSESWLIRKENEVTLQWAEMRMIWWMCDVKVKTRVRSKEKRKRLHVENVILVFSQNRLRWYGHVLRKDANDWVKKCMEYKLEGSRSKGRPKRTRREVVQKDSSNTQIEQRGCHWSW